MSPAGWEDLRAAIGRARALLCDWDGCLAIDNRVLPNVVDALRAGPAFAIVSNNSTLPRPAYAAMLEAQGLSVEERCVHLAGDTLLREARLAFGDAPLDVVGTAAMKQAARDLGLNLEDRAPKAVLLLRDTGFDFTTLKRVANHVRDGALLWVANSDVSHPVECGVTPETGALAAAVVAMTGRPPDRIIGKPAPLLFHAALAALQVEPADALMIGDNLDTDIVGAQAIGVPTCLVDVTSWAAPTFQ